MSKAKTNALDALRALIAERQQYEQWISTLEAKREGTPEHVFERVHHDYQSRLDRVVTEIKGYAEELQLSISTLSARLVEVARDEDMRRESLQEAELRAAVGEYETAQWEQIRTDAESALEKIAADRVSLDGQLSELRAIQKLSEMGPGGIPEAPSASPAGATAAPAAVAPPAPQVEAQTADVQVAAQKPAVEPPPRAPEKEIAGGAPSSSGAAASGAASSDSGASAGHRSGTAAAPRPAPAEPPRAAASEPVAQPRQDNVPLEPIAAAASAAASAASKPRSMKSPTGGVQAVRSRTEAARPDAAKTLKCPECGTANYPTEWYCERCGGELATM